MLFESLKIAHPLIEYNDEALKLVISLKEKFKDKVYDRNQIDEMLFENITQRRIVLTKKLLVFESFANIYSRSKISDSLFRILNVEFTPSQLLWSMKFTLKLYNDEISDEQLVKTRLYLDENFDFETYSLKQSDSSKLSNDINNTKKLEEGESDAIGYSDVGKCTSCGDCFSFINTELTKDLPVLSSSNNQTLSKVNVINISIEKSDAVELSAYKERLSSQQKEVQSLQDEKTRLENQKKRAEGILTLLKQFIKLKDFFTSNTWLCSFMLGFIQKVLDGSSRLDDTNFIKEIVCFYLQNEATILEGGYTSYSDFVFQEEDEPTTDEELYNKKIELIGEAFKHMEAHLYAKIQEILNDS